MPAPDTISLASISGPWPAIALSGITGTGAADMNGTHFMTPSAGQEYRAATGARIYTDDFEAGAWYIAHSLNSDQFEGTGPWPWLVTSWSPVGAATGAPAMVRALAPPVSADLGGGSAAVKATLTTALAGANNDLVFSAVFAGRLGNDIRIRYLDPAASNASLFISVSGRDITVNLATGAGGAITTTAADIAAAIDETEVDEVPVDAEAAPGTTDGSGVVTAMAWTNLSGGAGGLPLPPDTVTI